MDTTTCAFCTETPVFEITFYTDLRTQHLACRECTNKNIFDIFCPESL